MFVECESVEEYAKLVTTELMYKLMVPNISALIRAQKPANTTEFVKAADLYISGSRLDRSKLWHQRGGRQHFTPYRYPFKEQQPSSPHNTTAPSASPQFRQSNQLSQPVPRPTNDSNPSGLFKKDRRHLQQKPHRLSKYFDDKKGPLCFQCKNWGHLSAVCPEKVPSLFAMGKVVSMPVRFFLDSGADLTIVSDGLVHELARNGTQIINPSEDVTIKCVHAPFTSLPTIHLSCELWDSKFDMKMAISNDISHDVILGRDCPKLYDLMTNAITEIPQEILAVQTRQQTPVSTSK